MSILAPADEAAAILNHYFAQLAQRAGVRWNDRNSADITRAAALLGLAGADEALDTIPPYEPPRPPKQLDSRVTVNFDRDQAREQAEQDPEYLRWKARQRDERATQRMINRER